MDAPTHSISTYPVTSGGYKARLTYALPGQAPQRKYFTHHTKKGASDRARAWWSELERGLQTEKRLTLAVYLTRWLDGRARIRARASTVASYRIACARITAIAGNTLLRDVTPATAQDVMAALVAHPYAPSTIRTTRRIFSAAMRDAVRDRLLADNPVPDSVAPRAPKKKRRRLSAPEAIRFLRLAEDSGDSFWSLWVVLLNTGLRIGEALGLRWQDVNLDTRTLTSAGQITRTRGARPHFLWGPRKTKEEGDEHMLPLTTAAADALRRRRADQEAERARAGAAWEDEYGGLVFTNPWGRPLHSSHVYQRFKKALDRAGLPREVRVHDLRHSVATMLLGQETPLAVISALLGHSGIAITADTYTHADLDLLRVALKRLEDALGETER